jgi:hypothetical protein
MPNEVKTRHCSVCGIESNGTDRDGFPAETIFGLLYPVTFYGKPNNPIRGFICARCLGEANKMREYLKSQLQNVQVSKHAIDRYLERQKGERVSDEAARIAILRLFGHAQRIAFRQEFMTERLLKHGKPASYFFHQGWIFVVTEDEPTTILTIEHQWARRLGRDFWYAD